MESRRKKYKYPKNAYNMKQTQGMNVKVGMFNPELNTEMFNKNTTYNTQKNHDDSTNQTDSSSESSDVGNAGGECGSGASL